MPQWDHTIIRYVCAGHDFPIHDAEGVSHWFSGQRLLTDGTSENSSSRHWCENSLGYSHFHGFGVALQGPWNTSVNKGSRAFLWDTKRLFRGRKMLAREGASAYERASP